MAESKKLVKNELKCPHCETYCLAIKDASCNDRFLWCCPHFRRKIFIVKGQFFSSEVIYRLKYWSNPKKGVSHYLAIIYLFSLKIPVNVCEKLPHRFVSYRVLIDWFNFCRKIKSMYLGGSPVKLGGKGKTVEIDKSKFGKKRKYNEGKVPNPGFWVLWIINS